MWRCVLEKCREREQRMKEPPMVCRACDAGLRHGACVFQGVVYYMVCTHCEEFYIGETDQTVREGFNEHYQDSKKLRGWRLPGAHIIITDTENLWRPTPFNLFTRRRFSAESPHSHPEDYWKRLRSGDDDRKWTMTTDGDCWTDEQN